MRKLAAVVFCLVCAQGTVNAQQENVITSAVVDKVNGLVLLAEDTRTIGNIFRTLRTGRANATPPSRSSECRCA